MRNYRVCNLDEGLIILYTQYIEYSKFKKILIFLKLF